MFRPVAPPLRERREDIPLLVAHFLSGANAGARMTAAAMDRLAEHRFPGNVRELKHAVERALVVAQAAEIRPGHLPASVTGTPGGVRGSAQGDVVADLRARVVEGSEPFWPLFRDPFLSRDLSREDAQRFVEWAFEEGGRSYRAMAELLRIPDEHRRLENFLNHHRVKPRPRRPGGAT